MLIRFSEYCFRAVPVELLGVESRFYSGLDDVEVRGQIEVARSEQAVMTDVSINFDRYTQPWILGFFFGKEGQNRIAKGVTGLSN